MSGEELLNLEAVAKIYGHRLIFKNLNFKFHSGETALITGSNGAGKSTLLKIIAGLVTPSAGKMKKKAGLRIAYLGHATFLYPGLTAIENLDFWARAAGISAGKDFLLEVLKKVNLLPHAYEQTRIFSRGMAQRLNFARVMLLEPDLFLLDEPFTGMDAASRELVIAAMTFFRDKGAAILMVSHDAELDKALCNKIFLIADKTLVPVGFSC